MKPFRTTSYFFVILIASLFLFTHCLIFGGIEDRMTETYAVGPGGTLTIETDIGSIAIKGQDTGSVGIEILREVRTNSEKKAAEILEDFDIEFNHFGDDVTIKAKYKKGALKGFWNNIGKHFRVKFIISVPTKYNIDLHTKGGSISVEDVEGEILSETSGGSLKFNDIIGNISGNTSGGSISIGDVVGESRIQTSGGSIHIRHAEGPVDAHTSGGSVTVDEVMGAIEAHTSGGSVKAYISKQPDSDCRLTTSGGSITVQFSEDMNFDLDANSSGGRVYTDFKVSISGTVDKRSLRGKVNGGGPELYLRTSGGSIYLKKL